MFTWSQTVPTAAEPAVCTVSHWWWAEWRNESRPAAGHWVHVLTSEFMDSGGHAHSLSTCRIWDSTEVFSWRSSCSSGWCSWCGVVVVLMLQSCWAECVPTLCVSTHSAQRSNYRSIYHRDNTHCNKQHNLIFLTDFLLISNSVLMDQDLTSTEEHTKSDQSLIKRSISKQ